MSSKHHVIIVPGLGNNIAALMWSTKGWSRDRFIPHIFDARWKTEEPGLQPKLDRAIALVDELTAHGETVSLIGNSAGSSFVLNLFAARKNKIHKVIINCGRVRAGDWPWHTFAQATKDSPSFKESVLRSEKVISTLSKADKKKILTLRPLFDEVVPPYTVTIPGVTNIVIPSVEHVVSMSLYLTLFRGKIFDFFH